jgi:metal transporter CNNM
MTYIIVIILIILSGLFSGLNLGLMGLNAQELKRKAKLGDKNAKKIYPLRKTGNFLLVTLLLGNVAVNAVIAILLGSITSGLLAAIISTAVITIFGEIIPQATFTRYALFFGAKFTWIVKIFMYGLYPITKPIAWILDKVLGQELNTIYSKGELIEIIKEHRRSSDSDVGHEEEKIIKGALLFTEKKVKDIMTPENMITSFEISEKIDDKLIEKILDSGLSRFPVYEKKINNFVGLLYNNEVFRKNNRGKTIGSLASKNVIFINHDKSLVQIFNKLLKSHHPLAIVVNEFKTVIGLITLEDLIEEIIQDEIVDEDDTYIDMRKGVKA